MASQTAKSTAKTISSRLLSMKFMQRGVASASSSPTTPESDEEHSAKRRKVSHASSAKKEPSTPIIDQKAVQAALEEEEKKRQAAIEKQAAELGDSHWVLGVPEPPSKSGKAPQTPLNVIQVGFAQIDTKGPNDSDSPQSVEAVRPSNGHFRRFNMQKKTTKASDDESESDSDASGSSEDDSSESSSPALREHDTRGRQRAAHDGIRKRARSEVSSKRSAERARAQQYAEKRRKKEVTLNSLTSISSQGPKLCFRCGKPGHTVSQCKGNDNR